MAQTRSRSRSSDPAAPIARRLPSYESAAEQLQMAEAVAQAIDGPGHLMVEAGTGVGKSFAYLVPAILAAVEQRQEGRRLDPHDQPPGATAPARTSRSCGR